MLAYPQLTSGALAQFPIVKRRRQRTIINTLTDSTSVKLADPYGEITEWQLRYTGLSDGEVNVLRQFFEAAEGSLNAFTFLDPTSNLLNWSDQPSTSVWTKDPFLSVTAQVRDPIGGLDGSRLENTGAGPQTIAQTLSVPGAYWYCFSAYGRSDQAATLTLHCGLTQIDWRLETSWRRMSLTGSGGSSAQSVVFGIEFPPAASAEIFGLQAEPQLSASLYKPSEIGGVYEAAHFRDDVFSFMTTDVNRHSAVVNIIHANSL